MFIETFGNGDKVVTTSDSTTLNNSGWTNSDTLNTN